MQRLCLAFASNVKNGFCGKMWSCSHSTVAFSTIGLQKSKENASADVTYELTITTSRRKVTEKEYIPGERFENEYHKSVTVL